MINNADNDIKNVLDSANNAPSCSTARALHDIVNPRSVALVGVSNSPEKIGYMTLETLIASGYRSNIYPVNPASDFLQGLMCYHSISAIPGDV